MREGEEGTYYIIHGDMEITRLHNMQKETEVVVAIATANNKPELYCKQARWRNKVMDYALCMAATGL